MTRVTEMLQSITYINQGHNGWTSGGIANDIDKLGLVKADVYSIFLGTNDWWQGRQIGTFADYEKKTGSNTIYGAYRIIIDKLRNLNKDAKIILVAPMQRADFVYLADMKNNAHGSYKEKNGQLLSQVADAIINLGKREKFPIVDLYNKSGMTVKKLVKYKRLKDSKTSVYNNYKYPDYINLPFNPIADDYPYPESAIGFTYDGLHPSDQGNQVIAKMLVKVLKELEL